MPNLESAGKVFSSDVLIVGAGLAGFIAAIRIKELNPSLDVLIVEKSTAALSGAKANKGAGVMWVMDETDDVDTFLDYFSRTTGHFLEDQVLLEDFCKKTLEVVSHFERWGIKLCRDEQGRLSKSTGLPLWSLCALDLDILLRLRKIALKLGVKFVNKTQCVELLTAGNRVAGSVGFDLIDGSYKIFKAKSVIVATGSCCWMVANMWSSARGDGIAAAYRAGAVMRNAEFSNFYNLGYRGNQACPVGGQYALYNSEGEYLAPKYCNEYEHDIDLGIILGMEKEVMEGKGPIVMEESEWFAKNPLAISAFLFKWDRPQAKKFWGLAMEKESKYTSDHAWRPEIFPMFIGECSPVMTDHQMKSSLEGMWALGDANKSGAGLFGAVPPPNRLRGTGLAWSSVSALLSEKSVVESTGQAREPVIDLEQVQRFKEEIYAPMRREQGISPREPILRLQEAVAPPRFSARKSKERLEEAMGMVRQAQQQYETEVSPAGDWHMLGLCHDFRNMAQCAEMYFTAALSRAETRGWHYREDFPRRDDQNWRRWIDLKQQDGKMTVSTTRIPFEQYKIPLQPVSPERERIFANLRRVEVCDRNAKRSAPSEVDANTISIFATHARALTPEEQAKSYSKYYYQTPAFPAPERLAAMNVPMDPAKALPLQQLNDLLDPGDLEVETGWCQMPDGTGFIANQLSMPGVTVEMMNWWFAWFCLEDLRYKLWYPPAHFAVSISNRDRARTLDQRLPLEQRRLRTEYVVENTGGPCAEKIAISFMPPERFGFDMSRFKSPNVGTAICANGAALMLDPPPGLPNFKMAACLCHFIREIPGGVELRTRFWMGWHVLNQKPERLIPEGVRIPDIAIRGLALHNVHEFANLASFLPQLYEEQRGVVV